MTRSAARNTRRRRPVVHDLGHLGILQQELDRTEPDDFIGHFVDDTRQVALRQDRAPLAQQLERLLAYAHAAFGARRENTSPRQAPRASTPVTFCYRIAAIRPRHDRVGAGEPNAAMPAPELSDHVVAGARTPRGCRGFPSPCLDMLGARA
jgi:hypothetical protein